MQKRILGLIGIIVLWSNLAEASIVSLPRYTGDISSRYNEANIGKTEKLSCAERGKVDKPSDSCQKCVNEYAGCCDYIECSTASNCYKYTSADAEKYTCASSCQDRSGKHYKDCRYQLTCKDVLGMTTEEASPYIAAGFYCSQAKTTCKIVNGTTLGSCKQSSVSLGGESNSGSLGGMISGGSTSEQSIICYTCTCPEGTYNTVQGGKSCTVSHQVGNSKCYTCGCPAGTYGEDCKACPTGSYSSTAGASTCRGCPAGYGAKTGVTGATSQEAACSICPQGTYKANIGLGSCTACPTGYDAIAGVTGATSVTQACARSCVQCSTAIYPLLTCPSHAVCEECTPKNCEDNTTRYKISYCEDGYKQSGTSCVAKTCEELGYLSSIPSGQNCTPITTTAGRCYTNCSNQYSTCQEWLDGTGHNAIVVTGGFASIAKEGKYDEILYSSDDTIETEYNVPLLKHNVTIAPASIYEQESGGLCKSAVKSLSFGNFIANASTIKIIGTQLYVGDTLESNGGLFKISLSDDSSLQANGLINAISGSIDITGGKIIGNIPDITIQNSNYVNLESDTSNNYFEGIYITGENSSLSATIVDVDEVNLYQGASLNLTHARSIYEIYISTILNYCSSCGISIGTPGEDVVIEEGIRMEAPGDYNLTIFGNVSMGGDLDVVKSGVYAPEYIPYINIQGTLNMNNHAILLNGALQLAVAGHGKLLNPSSIKVNLPPDSIYGSYDYSIDLNQIEIVVGNGGAIKMGGVCRMLGSDMFIRTYRNKCSCTSVIPSCYCPGNMTITSLSQMYNYASDSNGYPIKGTPLSSMGSSCSY